MSENGRGRVLKNIAGYLLLVAVLHYALDEPTRLIRFFFRRPTRSLLLLPDPQPDYRPGPDGVIDYQRLLVDPSFERWDVHPEPIPQTWFSSVTIGPSEVVKKDTGTVQNGWAAARLFCDGGGHCGNVRQALPQEAIPWLRNRRLKFSVWTLSLKPGAPCVYIDDGVDRSSACFQNPTGTWEPLTVEHTISQDATRVLLIVEIPRAAETTESIYVDNASLTELQPPAPVTPPPSSASSEPQ